MAMGAPVQNTYGTQDTGTLTPAAVGQREHLVDTIARIDPSEVPFYSNTPKETQNNVLIEWQYQDLDAVDNTAQPEGFEATFDPAIETVRPGNYAQIIARSTIVSGTLDAVDTAGRDRESTYQKMLKGLEVRRDLESTLLKNVARSGTDPRVMGGFPAWITNGDWGSGGNAAAPTGDGTDAAGIDTGKAQSFDIFDKVLESCYNAGGEPRMMLFTPNAKRQFSGINDAGDQLPSQNRHNRNSDTPTTYIGSVGVYVSDFGTLECVVDRFAQGSSPLGGNAQDSNASPAPYESIYLVDKRHVSITSLPGRAFMAERLAKTGDAEKWMVLYEGTLKVSAPKAHGFIASSTLA